MIKPSEPGIRKCIRCNWLFVSPDPLRIWRCLDCKQQEESYQPRIAHITQVNQAALFHLKE